MKKLVFSFLILLAVGANAQEKEKVQAAKGVVYGVVTENAKPISPEDIKAKLVNDQFEGQVKAKVVEVCKAEGCWIKVERKDGTSMMVRAKDHKFLMPENIVGKTVLIDGNATIKEVTEEMRKHYAEDAGKSKEEIAKIKGSEKDVQFAAKGVKVLD
jgi:disulfide oxidoreductase YuzD